MGEASNQLISIDPRSGFCRSNSTFYSKRKPIPLPSDEATNITTFICSRAQHGKIAFVDASTGHHLTFSDVWRAVGAVATCLSDMGVRKGHVILLLSPNSIFFPVVCLAVMSLGAIITTTNPLNTPAEIAKQVADSKPVFAFTTPQLVPKLADTSLPIILISNRTGPQTQNLGKNNKIITTLQEMIRKKPPGQRKVNGYVTMDDPATLLYSSGTTGPSKGVVSSHKNLIAMAQIFLERLKLINKKGQIFICTVPMYHIYGLAAFATGYIASGSTIVVLPKFEMDDMLSAIQKYRATYLPLVPTILVALVNNADLIKKKYDLGSLETVICGGAALSKELIEAFLEKYPDVAILQGYGLTESTAVAASMDTLEDSRRRCGASGLLTHSIEAKIVDPQSGRALQVRQVGELWLRGPTIMKGYFSNEEATATTLSSDGWLRTGDLCYIDEDGFLFVVDRLKELIKYKGYQVPPAELEALLLAHPEVADTAVIPFPDKEVGQFPMAYIVRKTGSSMSETAIMDFIAKQVAPYKKIRRVTFVDSIPKNPTGKILRKDLIKLATSKL